MKTIPLTFRDDLIEANAKRIKRCTRRLVKPGNSIVHPGDFAGVDFATGRAKRVSDELGVIRAQCDFEHGVRVVTVSPKVQAGDLLWVRQPRGLRSASRQTLLVRTVRGCRIQDMTDADALAEGIIAVTGYSASLSHRANFAVLWDAINGSGAWQRNDWVWVYEYSVSDRNIDAKAVQP